MTGADHARGPTWHPAAGGGTAQGHDRHPPGAPGLTVPSATWHDPGPSGGSPPATAPTLLGQAPEGPGPAPPTGADDAPWRDGRFWLLQAVVVCLYVGRLLVELAVTGNTVPHLADFTTLGLFVWPVLYAAVTFGPAGATITAALIAVLSAPRGLAYASATDGVGLWSESTQVVVLCVLALVVGRLVRAERAARHAADTARRHHLAAEARYRGLFEAAPTPIVLVDGLGTVVEANPAACAVLAPEAPSAVVGRSLAALVGADTARSLFDLARRAATGERPPLAVFGRRTPAVAAPGPDGPAGRVTPDAGRAPDGRAVPGTEEDPEAGPLVLLEPEGVPLQFRASATPLAEPGREALVQIVLSDITPETRRTAWMEGYAARVLDAQEEERRRIAQELHDGPLQALVHLCRRIDDARLAATHGDATAPLEDLRHLAERLVDEVRGISRGLRPSVLDDLGLPAAVGRLLQDLERRSGLQGSLGVSGTPRRLAPPVELALFRVAQEALTNVEHHAQATRVAVGLAFEEHGVRLLVSDDGSGFDVTRASGGSGGSMGIVGMRERIHLAGGRVRIHSGHGEGSTVDAWVPDGPPPSRR